MQRRSFVQCILAALTALAALALRPFQARATSACKPHPDGYELYHFRPGCGSDSLQPVCWPEQQPGHLYLFLAWRDGQLQTVDLTRITSGPHASLSMRDHHRRAVNFPRTFQAMQLNPRGACGFGYVTVPIWELLAVLPANYYQRHLDWHNVYSQIEARLSQMTLVTGRCLGKSTSRALWTRRQPRTTAWDVCRRQIQRTRQRLHLS